MKERLTRVWGERCLIMQPPVIFTDSRSPRARDGDDDLDCCIRRSDAALQMTRDIEMRADA